MRPAPASVIAAIALTMTACSNASSGGGDGNSSGGDLTGVTWVLDHASMMVLAADMPDDAVIDIRFDGSQASGLAACNRYGGGYQADSEAGTLTFSQLAATEMACDPPLMALEAAYLAALGNVTTYDVLGDGKWLLLTAGNKALTFAAQQPAEALPLAGTVWTLTTIATPDTQAVSSTVAGTKVTATFDGGAVSGSGGCNRYHGAYSADGSGSLSIGSVAATKMMCAANVSDQEQAYFASLEKVASYAIEGDQLTLSDANGTMLLQFSGTAAR
jgi:heat shock protein HslJ